MNQTEQDCTSGTIKHRSQVDRVAVVHLDMCVSSMAVGAEKSTLIELGDELLASVEMNVCVDHVRDVRHLARAIDMISIEAVVWKNVDCDLAFAALGLLETPLHEQRRSMGRLGRCSTIGAGECRDAVMYRTKQAQQKYAIRGVRIDLGMKCGRIANLGECEDFADGAEVIDVAQAPVDLALRRCAVTAECDGFEVIDECDRIGGGVARSLSLRLGVGGVGLALLFFRGRILVCVGRATASSGEAIELTFATAALFVGECGKIAAYAFGTSAGRLAHID